MAGLQSAEVEVASPCPSVRLFFFFPSVLNTWWNTFALLMVDSFIFWQTWQLPPGPMLLKISLPGLQFILPRSN